MAETIHNRTDAASGAGASSRVENAAAATEARERRAALDEARAERVVSTEPRYVGAERETYGQRERYRGYGRRDDEGGLQEYTHYVSDNPLMAVAAIGALGFMMASLFYARSGSQPEDEPRGRRSGKPLIESDRVDGTAVYDQNGRRVGSVQRLMIDKVSGRVAYAVVTFGGMLGIGADEYPIDWNNLDYSVRLGGYRLNLTEEELRRSPTLDEWDGRDTGARGDGYTMRYYWLVG